MVRKASKQAKQAFAIAMSYIRKGMARKQAFKKAWASVKGKVARPKPKNPYRRVKRTMTPDPGRRFWRRRRGSRGGFSTAGLFKIVRLVALCAPAAGVALGSGDAKSKMDDGVALYTGYRMSDKSFDPKRLASGYVPFLAASMITYGIPKVTKLIRRLI